MTDLALPTAAPASEEFRRRARLYTGRVLSALFVALLAYDAAVRLAGQGVLAAGCEIGLMGLYLIRRTAGLGAALVTGLLMGSAVLRAWSGAPAEAAALFAVYLTGLGWGGLWLRRGMA